MSKKVLGLMAGMGPLTTVDFLSRLVEQSAGPEDQDHLHLIIDHDPTIPNRQQALAGSGPDVTDHLVHMAQRLQRAGADYLAMSCNTAHAYQEAITKAVDIPFISIIDTSADHLQSHFQASTVGLLATRGCLAANLYQQCLRERGLQWIEPTETVQDKLMETIFEIKAGKTGTDTSQSVISVVNELVFSGADVLLIACTELPLVLRGYSAPVPLIDATDLLVQRCIKEAEGI